MRENYCGSAPNDDQEFSVELVSNIILKLKRGKAAGLDSLTAEHLVHCHPSLSCILSKLFNLIRGVDLFQTLGGGSKFFLAQIRGFSLGDILYNLLYCRRVLAPFCGKHLIMANPGA